MRHRTLERYESLASLQLARYRVRYADAKRGREGGAASERAEGRDRFRLQPRRTQTQKRIRKATREREGMSCGEGGVDQHCLPCPLRYAYYARPVGSSRLPINSTADRSDPIVLPPVPSPISDHQLSSSPLLSSPLLSSGYVHTRDRGLLSSIALHALLLPLPA